MLADSNCQREVVHVQQKAATIVYWNEVSQLLTC